MERHIIEAIAKSVRALAIDAIEDAGSGHPGLPLGLAELGAILYGKTLRHYPRKPQWVNRDRFVLSAGHGSMLQYALLHLAGFDVSLEQLQKFRQVGSITPGHPEYGCAPGVETTTGPLGQGIGNAVGMAIAETHLGAQFIDREGALIDHYTYCVASDGDLMEGVSSESASLAGHLQLGKLIVFFDDNEITIEGSTDLVISENIEQRYAAYGWQTLSVEVYNIEDIFRAIEQARADTIHPTLIRCSSQIGKGSPNKAGSPSAHGAPLGSAEAKLTKDALGISGRYVIEDDARQYFAKHIHEQQREYEAWHRRYTAWRTANEGNRIRWEQYYGDTEDITALDLPNCADEHPMATRSSSGAVLRAAASLLPNLIGGSADLAPSTMTAMPEHGDFTASHRAGRTIHFGTREHAMGAICNGMVLHGGIRPFCATFLVFSDYMRPSIRLAAIMGLPVIYIMTHDSIYVGEDGPTHQPIEHIAALRAIPHIEVWRPADGDECVVAWRRALSRNDGPTVLILSRQKLTYLTKPNGWQDKAVHGAYQVCEQEGDVDTILLASGSEVALAMEAAERCPERRIRVVSIACRERFEAAPVDYRRRLLPPGVRVIVVEAGIRCGWEHYAQRAEDLFVLNDFGKSGKARDVAHAMGFTADRLKELIMAY